MLYDRRQTVNMSKVVVAAGMIVFRRLSNEVQYLMLQASYGDFHWSPPKGHVDPGETEMQAALRETHEEAGFAPDQLKVFEDFEAVLNYQVRGKPKKVIYWLSELKNATDSVKISDEHKDMKWLGIDDAIEIAQYDDMRSALSKANEYVTSKL